MKKILALGLTFAAILSLSFGCGCIGDDPIPEDVWFVHIIADGNLTDTDVDNLNMAMIYISKIQSTSVKGSWEIFHNSTLYSAGDWDYTPPEPVSYGWSVYLEDGNEFGGYADTYDKAVARIEEIHGNTELAGQYWIYLDGAFYKEGEWEAVYVYSEPVIDSTYSIRIYVDGDRVMTSTGLTLSQVYQVIPDLRDAYLQGYILVEEELQGHRYFMYFETPEPEPEPTVLPTPETIPYMEIDIPEGTGYWEVYEIISDAFEYQVDYDGEPSQHPMQTWYLMNDGISNNDGDCDDYASLLAYIAQEIYEYDSFIGRMDTDGNGFSDHAVCFVGASDEAGQSLANKGYYVVKIPSLGKSYVALDWTLKSWENSDTYNITAREEWTWYVGRDI